MHHSHSSDYATASHSHMHHPPVDHNTTPSHSLMHHSPMDHHTTATDNPHHSLGLSGSQVILQSLNDRSRHGGNLPAPPPMYTSRPRKTSDLDVDLEASGRAHVRQHGYPYHCMTMEDSRRRRQQAQQQERQQRRPMRWVEWLRSEKADACWAATFICLFLALLVSVGVAAWYFICSRR